MQMRLTLAAPARCNSLEPSILLELARGLDRARDEGAAVVTLRAEGRHFSTGGDVSAFLAACEAGNGDAYADQVVGLLQGIVRRLLSMPAIVLTAAQGAVTGGSAGLIFASDLVILAEDAFLQPYFTAVGFSPDGGWSALLPERIGAGRALQIQLTNERVDAAAACALGLARQTVPTAHLDTALDALTERIARDHDIDAMLDAKMLVWDDARLARIDTRLEAELRSFKRRIATAASLKGMRAFLDQRAEAV